MLHRRLALALMLETRDGITLEALAEALDASIRTISRDLQAIRDLKSFKGKVLWTCPECSAIHMKEPKDCIERPTVWAEERKLQGLKASLQRAEA